VPLMKPNSFSPKLVGVPAAADVLGLSKRMVYLLASTGRLQTCRIGKRVLIPVEELDRFIADHIRTVPTDRP
jgi:excisionase family DNA binding protein